MFFARHINLGGGLSFDITIKDNHSKEILSVFRHEE